MDIIGKKYLYFIFSLIIIIPGIISLFLFGLKLSIDFTGGSRITLSFPDKVSNKIVKSVQETLSSEKIKISTLETANKFIFIRTESLSQKQHGSLVMNLSKKFKEVKWEQFETIGPTIGKETTENAIKAVLLSSVLIVLYIAWSFRKVPKPASSFRFGACAIIALIHDILVVVGVFSILGYFFGIEVDSLFVTALLTVIGFSVHDTIVVFDRIRENLRKLNGIPFAKIVNESILETLARSINTSLTVVLVLIALLLFGGESIRWFVVVLLIGIISGTYSSIFNASPLLVVWHERSAKH